MESSADPALSAVGFETRHVAGDIHGYGGPLNLWVRFDRRGTLEQVVLRDHHETPAYIRGLGDWLQLFEGHPYDRPFGGPRGVDTLSGATVTCEAIQAILTRARARAGRELLGLTGPAGPPPRGRPSFVSRFLSWFSSARSWIVLAGLALMVLLYLGGRYRARIGFLALSVAVFGFWLNVPFTLPDVASLGLGAWPGAADKALLVLGVVLLSLCFGQIWCGYGCPFGALQELLWLATHPRGWAGARGLGPARQLTPSLEMHARYLKFFLAVLTLSYFWISSNPAYLDLDPMPTAFTRHVPAAVVGLLVVIGMGALWLFRPFCRYLCPAGALLAMTNKVRLLDRLGVGPHRPYGRCDLGVTSDGHVDCIRCHRCLPSPASSTEPGSSSQG
jgi:hypothetical protein